MNKHEIELNIELLKGNVDGFKALLAEQPDHPMRGSIEHQIDALKMAISALEKQLPKKIDRVGNKCPVCKCYLASKPIGDNYCFNCSQAIDWGNENE